MAPTLTRRRRRGRVVGARTGRSGAAVVLLLVACSAEEDAFAVAGLSALVDGPPPEGRFHEVDLSAGPVEEWALVTRLSIGSRPEGGGSGAAEEFFQVITDVQLLGDGRIAVLDPSAFQVAVYDGEGGLDAVLGREGDGPGEFRYPEGVRECGSGAIHVLEGSTMRMKVFHPDGSFRDEYRLFGHNPNQPFWRWDCADDRILTMQWGDGDPRVGPVGRFRKQVPLALSGPDGRVTTRLGRILGPERYRYENRGTGPAPLGAVTGLAIHDGVVYVAEGPELRVDAFSFAGDHLRAVQASVEPRPVDRNAYIESQRPGQMTEAERRAFDASWRDWDLPGLLPAFRGFLVDDEGSMWIERYPRPGDGTTDWWVIEPEGTWRATVEVAGNVELHDVAGGRAAGVRRGALDVESVVVFEIRSLGWRESP